jgi:hypothetical protein
MSMKGEINKERMLATLVTLLKVYIESHRRIPELERDLEDGAVKAIRRLIENSNKGTEVDEEFVSLAQSLLNPRPGYGGMYAPSKSSIRQMLREAGVRVREEGK